eukprot:3604940-Rhodomonas_salina.2
MPAPSEGLWAILMTGRVSSCDHDLPVPVPAPPPAALHLDKLEGNGTCRRGAGDWGGFRIEGGCTSSTPCPPALP